MNIIRKLISLIVLASSIRNPSFAAEKQEYDPQHTMLALNMAIVSVHRILATQDRLILDQEYQNIMNNLSLGNIRSDSDITKLYEKLMDIASQKRLREKEAEHVRKRYDSLMENRLTRAISEAAANSMKALEGESYSISESIAKWLFGLIPSCTASYFKYQARGNELRDELDENLYRLEVEDMKSFNEMQKQLLSSSWNLMNLYHLPDEFRLVQKSMDDFYRAVEEPDTASRRLRMLKALEEDFKVYPPYWYYRARTAQEVNDSSEAAKCFDKFDEVWRPVLRKDPYKLEVTKYRITELLKNGIPEDKKEIFELAGIMRENTLREDWANNLFAGILYYALGDEDTAKKCVEMNIDFDYEHDLSSAMLTQIRNGIDSSRLLSDTLRTLNLSRILSDLKSKDLEAALFVADYFDGRNPKLESCDNVLAIHARRIIEFRKCDASSFKTICDLAKLENVSKADIRRMYSGAFNMVKSYADTDNIPAQIFLADMYNYGWGVDMNINQAMIYYSKAGEKGDIYSQFMCESLVLSESAQRLPEESQKTEKTEESEESSSWWPF